MRICPALLASSFMASDLGQAAVDLDVRAVDVARPVRREERDDIGDFRGFRVPPYRNQTAEIVVEALEVGLLARKAIEARGYGRARADRVHTNPAALEVKSLRSSIHVLTKLRTAALVAE